MKNLFVVQEEFEKQVSTKIRKTTDDNEPADFEKAIAATGFGKFNFLVILIAIPTSWTTYFETTTMSFVFPAAQCDLSLSLEDKGLLNAMVYAGTIVSAFFWGFLFDTFGRRKLLMIGYFLDAICVILSSLSPNKMFLMAMKFMGGFIINGPYAAIATYLSELHVAKYRSRIPLLLGIGLAMADLYLPLLAALVLPLNFNIKVTDSFIFHSWGLYLFLNSMPSLLSFTIFIFLPESPKYLMSMGRNEDALKVFKSIYQMNTGRPAESYPINQLIEEKQEIETPHSSRSLSQAFDDGWEQIKPLFHFPHLTTFILVCSIYFCSFMSLNTLRLWLPQLFQIFTDYKLLNNGTSASLCEMLSVIRPSEGATRDCFVNFDNLEVYVNSAIVAGTSLLGYLIAGSLINNIGQKRLLNILTFIFGCMAAGIYFSPNDIVATAFLCAFKTVGIIGTNVNLVIIINLFPTVHRTMTVALALMFARGAAMLGNIFFPYLIDIGCAPPFFSIATLAFAWFTLSLLLPDQKRNFV